jgi:nitrite reductase (NO-forming)
MLNYAPKSNWLSIHSGEILSAARIFFGIVWILDGYFKFAFNTPNSLSQIVTYAGYGQPAWMQGWFTFWAGIISWSPPLSQALIGVTEILLGLLLVFGLLRKAVYLVGILFSLSIWSIAQSFGGPLAAGKVEVGSGLVYALVFFMLLVACSMQLETRFSLDPRITKKFSGWAQLSDF